MIHSIYFKYFKVSTFFNFFVSHEIIFIYLFEFLNLKFMIFTNFIEQIEENIQLKNVKI